MRRDADALAANWRALARMSGGAACGAAVKADGYGLGATWVATTLAAAGCRDFFVATWAEAAALAPLGLPAVSVLHGVRDEDMAAGAVGDRDAGAQYRGAGGAMARRRAAGRATSCSTPG